MDYILVPCQLHDSVFHMLSFHFLTPLALLLLASCLSFAFFSFPHSVSFPSFRLPAFRVLLCFWYFHKKHCARFFL